MMSIQRLTDRDAFWGELCSAYSRDSLIKRLWEYEETGLSPKEVQKMKDTLVETSNELAAVGVECRRLEQKLMCQST